MADIFAHRCNTVEVERHHDLRAVRPHRGRERWIEAPASALYNQYVLVVDSSRDAGPTPCNEERNDV
jgi:hypothetical protein